MKKVILLASAFSYRAELFEAAAARLGLEVVRGEDVPPPMFSKVNTPLAIDYRDIPRSAEIIEAYSKENPVGAIIGLDDSGTLIAAQACERLGLSYNSPEATLAARDKHIMRQRFATAGVPSPQFHLYQLSDDLEAAADETRYPAVVKPTSMSGSRGVMRVDDPMDFLKKTLRLRPILEGDGCAEFLVEDFIPGQEVALEGLLNNGKLHVLALFDKPDPLDGPFFEETIYVTPSRLPLPIQAEIQTITIKAAAALGLYQGPIHAELRVNDRGPWVVEVAARSIGGKCSKALQFGLDKALEAADAARPAQTSLEELILRQAFNMPFEPMTETEASGVMMIPIPEPGVLKAILGVEAARAVPLIEEIEITALLDQPLNSLPEGDSYLGFIFARGHSPEMVEAALREAHANLQFEIVPDLPLRKF